MMDRKINAATFKAHCLKLIDQVAETGEPITVTKRGKVKVQIVAVREKPKSLIGATKGTFKIVGDIIGSVGDHDEDREWRIYSGQFNDPPARYTHRPLDDRGPSEPRKAGKKGVRRRARR